MSLLPTSSKGLSNSMLSGISPYVEKMTEDPHCGFRCIGSIIGHTFCIPQIVEKKWEFNESVPQLLSDFKKAYNSVMRELFYNNFTESGTPIK
jgi:hypothetical protein